jgi:uncharacterized protein (TIGR03435 family)
LVRQVEERSKQSCQLIVFSGALHLRARKRLPSQTKSSRSVRVITTLWGKRLLFALTLSLLFQRGELLAQAPATGTVTQVNSISGTWQGTLGEGRLRLIVKIESAGGSLQADVYSVDRAAPPVRATSVSFTGSTFKANFVIAEYEGTLTPDGQSLKGIWKRGATPSALSLVRATPDTAWEIATYAAPKKMAADVDPSFEVATIKPNHSGISRTRGFRFNGREFQTENSSATDLVTFAYDLQKSQIVSQVDWLDKERFDVVATTDQAGAPNFEQVRTMLRKLLGERFALKCHYDVREMSAFVLDRTQQPPTLIATQFNESLPSLRFQVLPDGVEIQMLDGTLHDLTGYLQERVLDRPVIDQTGLAGRFDISLKFTPDETQFNGHPPKQPDSTGVSDSLFEAVRRQLGLKLEVKKAQVPVLVLDHIEPPSPN